ncbi:MAG: histidine phosphatase family protein [Thermodesulfobacteriota bacterium]|nr:histidine phosphatase family protein [Thermodesulfobacteriota bacterium]
MSTLYFIRHGQASFGKSDYDALSPVGELQSRLLADYLLSHHIHFDAILVGPQQRHRQTAGPLIEACMRKGNSGAEPEVIESPEMAEYDFASVLKELIPLMAEENEAFNRDAGLMFTDRKAFQRLFEAVMLRWVNGDHHLPVEMTWAAFKARVSHGVETLMARYGRGKNVAVFTSGGPISATIQEVLGLSDAMAMQVNWQVVNGSMTRFKCTHEKIMMASFNEYPWLEMHADREIITYR